VLNSQLEATDTAQRMVLALEDDDPFLRIHINANGEERNGQQARGAGAANNNPNPNGDDDPVDPVAPDAAAAAENSYAWADQPRRDKSLSIPEHRCVGRFQAASWARYYEAAKYGSCWP
jgi:hypothetical protein